MVYWVYMPRRKHLPLPVLLSLSLVCAVMAGALIQVRRPDIGRQAVQEQIEARTPRERCDRLGHEWTFVTRTNPDISLCYRTVWGWPHFEEDKALAQNRALSGYVIRFSNADVSPVLRLYSNQVTSSSYPVVNPESSNDELMQALGAYNVEKLEFQSKTVIKALILSEASTMFGKVHYFVPGDQWLHIETYGDYVDDIETMLRASL